MTNLEERIAELPADQKQLLLDRLRAPRTAGTAHSIPRLDRDSSDFALSYAQERLWFLDQLNPGNSFYNLCLAQRVGSIESRHLDGALTALVARHEALRTTIPVIEGEPVQRIGRPFAVRCPVVDLGHVTAEDQGAEIQRIGEALTTEPFDLAAGPNFRTTLIRTGRHDCVFVFVIHHILADAWSLEVLYRDLGMLYQNEASGTPAALHDIDVQYVDYAMWQRQWLGDGVLEKQLGYWTEQLGDLPTLDLVTDRPRPPTQSYRGAGIDFEIPDRLMNSLRRLGAQEDATLFLVLLSAYSMLLHQYSRQDDIAIGSPFANRSRTEIESTVGFFVNTLVLRVDLSEEPTYRELLGRVREMFLGAISHQDVPFSKLVAELRPQRDLSRNPLFQANFQLLASSQSTSGAPDQPRKDVFLDRSTSIFDIILSVVEVGDGALGRFEFNTDLFAHETIEQMRDHFLALLESIVAAPNVAINQLSMLAAGELDRTTRQFNATDSELIGPLSLHGLFEAQVQRTPDAPAVRIADQTVSYRNLDMAATALARDWTEQGIGPNERIAILARPSIDLVVGLFAILKSGNAYVPIDPDLPKARVSRIVDDSGAVLLLTNDPEGCAVDEHDLDIPVRVLDTVSPHMSQPAVGALPSKVGADPESLAYILFTSGSTGRPKGVKVSHRSVVNYLNWCAATYPIDAGIGAPLASPISSDMSVTSLFVPLVTGRMVVLLDDENFVEALDEVLRGDDEFSFVKMTPSHLTALRNLSIGRDVPVSAAAFVLGGEALHRDALAPWIEAAPDLLIYNEYGPTEATVGCCVHAVRARDIAPGFVPIGRPIANTRLHVLAAGDTLAPMGVLGELCISGDGLALGYVDEADDDGRFVELDPSIGRAYRTGDLVRHGHDGNLHYMGRIDRQVQIRGFRVEPGEIEAALTEHNNVADAAVAARAFAEFDLRLIAYLVLNNDDDSTQLRDDIVHFARQRLPGYAVPSRVMIVDAIPLTRNGKTDFSQLEAVASNISVADQTEPVAPASALESVVVQVFADVLHLTAVGTNQDFFTQLGGDSLLATKVVARVREFLQIDVSLRAVFEEPTAKLLAEHLAGLSETPEEAEMVADAVLGILRMSDEEIESALAAGQLSYNESEE